MSVDNKYIFYGTDSYASSLFTGKKGSAPREPDIKLSDGLCFASDNPEKTGGEFLGLPVLSLPVALDKYPDAKIFVCLSQAGKFNFFGKLQNENSNGIIEKIVNYEIVTKTIRVSRVAV